MRTILQPKFKRFKTIESMLASTVFKQLKKKNNKLSP